MEATRAALLLLKLFCALPSFTGITAFYSFLAGLRPAASTLWIQARTHLQWKPEHVHHHAGLHTPKPPPAAEEDQDDDNDEEDERCAVCLCGMEGKGEVWELRCNHLFHRGCLDRWVELQRTTCPLCREPLVEQDQEEEVGEDSAPSFMAYVHRSTCWVWQR